MTIFEKKSRISVCAQSAFDWHSRTGAIQRLIPPWEHVEIVDKKGTIQDGDQLTLRMKGLLGQDWIAIHQNFRQGEQFEDRQESGPFKSWVHTHRFEPVNDHHCEIIDHIQYELPAGPVGPLVGGGYVASKLESMFHYRHQVLKCDLLRHQQYLHKPRMRILVTGASGLVGTQMCAFLSTGGHEISVLTRKPSKLPFYKEILWDPAHGILDAALLEGFDAVVHLAGENIAGQRWNDEFKERIKSSRVKSTMLLSQTLAKLDRPPEVLISASATGFYGDRGDEVLTENSTPGRGFLADTCVAWEKSADAARDRGIRVVHPRISMVLSSAGGGLSKMMTPFQLGTGGAIGSGNQFWAWISLDDLVYAIHEMIQNHRFTGPINIASPVPPTNREFTHTLGGVLSRPTIVPAPAFAVKMMFGEMADALLLASARIVPQELVNEKFHYSYPDLKSALSHTMGYHTE